MPKLYKSLDDKRFYELDDADRNIYTQVMRNEAKHIEQFDNPMKFQNKFERMTAYEFQKGLELVKRELEAIVNEYNTGTLENREDTGKLVSYWNTLMAYLKNMLLVGGIPNRDIQKINNLLDDIKPLVNDVAMIAEEFDFVDKSQIEQLAEKFDGNNWTPIYILQKKKKPEEIEAPDVEDALDEEDDDFGLDEDDEQPPRRDWGMPENLEEDEEAPEEEEEEEAPEEAPPEEAEALEVKEDEKEPEEVVEVVVEPPKRTKKQKLQTILSNIMSFSLQDLQKYHKQLFGEKTRANNKYYLRNKLKPRLNQLINEEPEQVVGDGKPIRNKSSAIRYNDDLNDYYLFQGQK